VEMALNFRTSSSTTVDNARRAACSIGAAARRPDRTASMLVLALWGDDHSDHHKSSVVNASLG